MTVLVWIALPVLISVSSALIALFLMQHRLEVHLARERRSLAEARAALEAQKSAVEELGRLRLLEAKALIAEAAQKQRAEPQPLQRETPAVKREEAAADATEDLGALAQALSVFRGVAPETHAHAAVAPRRRES